MSVATIVWTTIALFAGVLLAAGGGHPPAIVLLPIVFAGWLVGSVVMEVVTQLRRRQRAFRRSFVFLVVTATLFVGVPATALLIIELTSRGRFLGDRQALVLLGPVCLVATAAALWELAHGRRAMPVVLLGGFGGSLLWFALRDSDAIGLATATAIAACQGAAVWLLVTNRVPRAGSINPAAEPTGSRSSV